MIDSSLIEEILQKADIVDIASHYINVIKKGRNYVALCPFHDDKNPSMMLSKDKQIFKCFVCGTGGNVFTFVQKYEKISYIEAVKKVAELIGFNDERLSEYTATKKVDNSLAPLYKCINDLTQYYQYALTTDEGTKAYEYLKTRHLDEDIQSEYKLGYAFEDPNLSIDFLKSKGNNLKEIEAIGFAGDLGGAFKDKNAGRVIFPIADINGQVVGFSARKLTNDKDTPKYVNTSETQLFKKNNILFNYHIAKNSAKHDGYVYVLEGFMDVFALRKIGITSAVALMGTAFTANHINLLRRLGVEVRMCLDGDNPGQMATMKCTSLLDKAGIPYRIVLSKNDTRDPDEILNDSPDGAEQLKKYLNCLVDKAEFALQYYTANNDLSSFESKNKLIKEFLPIMLSNNNQLQVENYILILTKYTGFTFETIKQIYEDAKKNANGNENDVNYSFKDFHPERKVLKRYAMAERAILYQMLNNGEAVQYFEENLDYFYDEVYQHIANYIIEYYEESGKVDKNVIIAMIDQSDNEEEATVLRNNAIEIITEDHHPEYSLSVMDDLKKVVNEEKIKLNKKMTLENALKGKTPQEQARIIDEMSHKKN